MIEKNDNVVFASVKGTKLKMTCKAEDNGTQDSHENRGSGRGSTVSKLDPDYRLPTPHKSCGAPAVYIERKSQASQWHCSN